MLYIIRWLMFLYKCIREYERLGNSSSQWIKTQLLAPVLT